MAPMSKLPAAVLAPIKPPFIPPPSFELPFIERPKFSRPKSLSAGGIQPMQPAGGALSKMRTSFLKPKDSYGSSPRKRAQISSARTANDDASKMPKKPSAARVRFAPILKITEDSNGNGNGNGNTDNDGSSESESSADIDVVDQDMKLILHKAGLDHLFSIFEEQEIELDAFVTLTDDDMTELGITNPEDCLALTKAIANVQQQQQQQQQQQKQQQ